MGIEIKYRNPSISTIKRIARRLLGRKAKDCAKRGDYIDSAYYRKRTSAYK